MSLRTDLAAEIKRLGKITENEGVSEEEIGSEGVNVTRIRILDSNGAKRMNRPVGTYITVDYSGAFSDDETYTEAVAMLSEQIKSLIGEAENKHILLIGLGNSDLTSDAVGPETLKAVIVTRHLKKGLPEIYSKIGLREVSALTPGVLGKTGIESSDIIKSVAAEIKPDIIIIIDALASRSTERLCSTVQLSDTGISPGSGVGNNRGEISQKTLGIPVIAIGIPTVVDSVTLSADTLRNALERLSETEAGKAKHISEISKAMNDNDFERLVRTVLSAEKGDNLTVTPRDIDALMKKSSRLLAAALNKALHTKLSDEDAAALLN